MSREAPSFQLAPSLHPFDVLPGELNAGLSKAARVWQKAHKLTLDTYASSAYLKVREAWPLRDQLLRASISVPSNIAEGAGRGSDLDFRRFFRHSLGSLNEVEYDLLLARDLGFLPAAEQSRLAGQVEEVRRMLSGLIGSLAR